MSRRKERVNELVRDALSEIIQREIKDPRIGFLSVTGVEVAPDLSSARVFISVIGDEAQQNDTLAVLQRARGFLRTALAQRIRSVRHIPELIFKADPSIKTGVRIFELLDQVKREESATTVPPVEGDAEGTASGNSPAGESSTGGSSTGESSTGAAFVGGGPRGDAAAGEGSNGESGTAAASPSSMGSTG